MMRIAGTAALLFCAAAAAQEGDRPLGGERLAVLLAAAADEESRAALLERIGPADVACPALAGFGGHADADLRERAVRTIDQAGCRAIEYYRPYMRDPHPWVTDALVTAFERLQIGDGIPFLIRHLPDPRRIVSSGGVWTLGERAHRALRAVSCQSMHYDPGDPPADRARAAARWVAWFAEHGGEPRDRWLDSGLERARGYVASDVERLRIEGIELLLLIAEPGAPALRAAFRRDSDDLQASLSCAPDEPPRVTDEVPCRFVVSNRSERRIALIPGEVDVAVRRPDETGGDAISRGGPRAADPPAASPAADQVAGLIGRVVDLAPGGSLRWPLSIGPVPSAGRYEVRGTLPDLSTGLVDPGGAGNEGEIEARTIVRFEP
jgi:hypothetical protein